jgi:predicted metal-dependent enzyme (double-stranded beta helix superfamily)
MTVSASTPAARRDETPPSPGCAALIEALEATLETPGTVEETTAAVERILRRLIAEGGIKLPAELTVAQPDTYARRLLHIDARRNYSILAMIWGPGQGTPLHDHAGMWCVEGVLAGQLEVTQYELLENDGAAFRFARRDSVTAGVGSAGQLIPPFEHHTIRNALADRASISVHVYGGQMVRCSIFTPCPDRAGWYTQSERVLTCAE